MKSCNSPTNLRNFISQSAKTNWAQGCLRFALAAFMVAMLAFTARADILVIPNVGPFAGGNTVTITNTTATFGTITNVLLDGVQATIDATDATSVTFTAPAVGSAGLKDILIQTAENVDTTLTGAYTVNPAGQIGVSVPGSGGWTNLSTGTDNSVWSLAYDGANVYAGGDFLTAGGVPANYVAKWDGTTWSNLGSGMNGTVYALVRAGANLYAGGAFTTADGATVNSVAVWNGASWSPLGTGMDGTVNSLAFDGVNLYAGGFFTTAGGVPASNIAMWNGASWSAVGTGTDGAVLALTYNGTILYAGGDFLNAGGVTVNYVAMWDGTTWAPLGSGMDSTVLTLTHDSANLYAGGAFTSANGASAAYVAMWNGASWSSLGTGMDTPVYALTSDGTNIYAGGTFTTAGGVAASSVAMWDGTSWTNMASGTDGFVFALAHAGVDLVAGGQFVTAGGVTAINIAEWNGAAPASSGVEPSSGPYTGGFTVVISGSNLGDGGDIIDVTLCGVSVASITSQSASQVIVVAGVGTPGLGDVRVFSKSFGETVKLNGFTYTGPGMQVLGVDGSVIATDSGASLANGTAFGHILVGTSVIHTFTLTNNAPTEAGIAGYATNGPDAAFFGVTGIPATIPGAGSVPITVTYHPLTIGSHTAFLTITNDPAAAPYTVNLSGSAFQISPVIGPFAGGNTVTITNGGLGTITNILVGGVQAAIVSALADSVTFTMPAFTTPGIKDIVIQTSDSGSFTLVGAYTVNPAGQIGSSVATSGAWTNLSTGTDNSVWALAYDGVNVYAGGDFLTAGGVPANYVATWDGTNWSNLGGGMDGTVYALVRAGANLYAGGAFTNADGATVNSVAVWNGTSWSPLGTGMDGTVNALAFDGVNLYAGGFFTTAGGVPANNIAMWNGTSWSAVGTGTDGAVLALTYDGVNLYAGGDFEVAGGVAVDFVARWNGTTWASLGAGMDSTVLSLTYDSANLYAGGAFTTAGGALANHVAMWNGTSWSPLGTGMDTSVSALTSDGTNLFAGGTFTTAGGVPASSVAMWDGTSWTNMASGTDGFVFALAHAGLDLVAGGQFATAGGVTAINIAEWNGTAPASSGVEPNSGPWTGGFTVVISGSNLGDGGDIIDVTLCGVSVASITSQSASQVIVVAGVGTPGLGDVRVFSKSFGETVKLNAFTYTGSSLEVLGVDGSVIASDTTPSLANGSAFGHVPVGSSILHNFTLTNSGPVDLNISGFATDGTDAAYFAVAGIPAIVPAGGAAAFTVTYNPLVVGDHTALLTITNDSPTNLYLVNLSGSAFQVTPASGPFAGGNTVVINNGNLGAITSILVGGVPALFDEFSANQVTITIPAIGSSGLVDIVIQTSDIGNITLAGAYTVNPAGQIGGFVTGPNAWTNLDSGLNERVYYGLAYDGTNLFAGGLFTTAGGQPANYVARWDGTNWFNLGIGMDERVLSLLLVGTNLYAAGDFTHAGGVSANHVARWDGTSWSAVGSGMNNSVNTLAYDGTYLYAGGDFTLADGLPANNMARWDGTSWSSVGGGMSGSSDSVRALVVDGPNLYVGGSFATAGGVPVSNMARWDGTTWSSLGTGMNGGVYRLELVGTSLYAGGSFTTAGGVPADDVAMWDGTSWSALGLGMDSTIFAMAHDGTNLYAGGAFTTADNQPANYVAMWNGTTWTNLGTGMDGRVLSLLHDGKSLYAGGWFTNAGGVLVNHIAKWTAPVTPFTGVEPSSGPWTGGFTVVISGSNLGNGSDITNVTLNGASVASITSQTSSEVVVVAAAGAPGLGDVRVFSTSFGETVKPNAFTYTAPGLQVLDSNGLLVANDSPASLVSGTDFGSVNLGSSVVHTFSLTNDGTTDLTITGYSTNGPDAANFAVDGIPTTIPVGGQTSFTITYSPLSAGGHTAYLTITNDSPANPYIVNLAGSAFSVIPNVGPFGGGNTVTLNNGLFGTITNVLVGGVQATILSSAANSVTFIMPAFASAGVKDIVLQTSDNGEITFPAAYTVNPAGQIGSSVAAFGAWTNLSTGTDSSVWALAHDGVNVYAGGDFLTAGGVPANYVAKWDGATWSNLGGGMDGTVYALVQAGASLYAGGAFTNADGTTVNSVAVWNGTSWSPLGAGMNGTVNALAFDGVNLYAGGSFTTAGGAPASNIAMWNGTSWSAVGSGTDGAVLALTCIGTTLYAGGDFLNAGGVPVNYVATWDGTTWAPLGTGMNTTVFALTHDSVNLYAGGSFVTAGGATANSVAMWNGTSWTALGAGMDPSVYALAYNGTSLYAGGTFTTAGGVAANSVAMWDGTSWTNLASGTDGFVYALSHNGTSLVAGGQFNIAGGVAAVDIAQWNATAPASTGVEPSSGPWTGGFTVIISGSNLGNGSDIYDVTLCGVSVTSITSQSASQVIVVAAPGTPGLGDVRVFSTSFGETVKANAFTYTAPVLEVLGTDGSVIASGSAASTVNGTDFGSLALGLKMTNQFSITNSGDQVLNISATALTGDATFALLDTLPATLAAGASSTFRVEFNPTAFGPSAATLWITNDAIAGTYSVLLSGAAVGSLGTETAGSTTWAGGGNFTWEINSATGTAGADPGWDLLDITGTLDITATSGSTFTLNLITLTPPANAPGAMANFDNTLAYDWMIVRASGGIIGFAPDRFSLNTSGFANGLNGGLLTLAQVGNELHVLFSPAGNHAPVAESITAGVRQGRSLTLSVAKLLARATDVDGDTLTLVGLSPSSAGMTLSLAAGQITYTPAIAFSGTDTFTYTIADGHGATATATVTVTVTPADAASINVVFGPVVNAGNFVVRFAGIPGYEYTIESTDSLLPATWVKKQNLIAPTTAGSFGVGVFEFTEPTGGATSRFYRTVWPAYE